jgi:hypothetical protein
MPRPPYYPKFRATLQGSESIRPPVEESVSEATRRAKEALAAQEVKSILLGSGEYVPVTGQYYDMIRAAQQVRTRAPRALTNQFVRGVYNKAGGVKSFAAANYSYPSGQMVIGAALAGGLGRVGKGVEVDGTSDFTFSVPAATVNAAFPESQINFALMNISWMSGKGPVISGNGCRTQMTNNAGAPVLGLKTGTFTYKNADKMRRIKAAAVIQAMANVGLSLTIPNLYFYGQVKAHDVGELESIMRQYPPGSTLPGNLLGDGSGDRSFYCRTDFDLSSFASPETVNLAIQAASAAAGSNDTGGGSGGGGYGYDPYRQPQEEGMSTAMIVGLSVAGLAVVGAAIYFFGFRNKA